MFKSFSSPTLQHTVNNLEAYTNYVFKVTPCNKGVQNDLCGTVDAVINVTTKIGGECLQALLFLLKVLIYDALL